MSAATYPFGGRCARIGLFAMTGRRGHGHHRGDMPFGPWMFGPRGYGRGPRARRGDVRAAALLLLAEEPRNGYQLMQKIEERSNGVWRPSAGSIYPALSQLEDEGLVRGEEQDGRRTFTLTDAGRTYVEEHKDELGAPWDEMSGAVGNDVTDFFGEIKRVAIAAAQIGRHGTAEQLTDAKKILAETRRSLYRLLAEDDPAGD
ncbi:MAG TPA: PadR family transcriptional regulator [Gaiellaceae bacterium]|nr:PadR family transcriptional regulator [Gaiellaceae bacterium]